MTSRPDPTPVPLNEPVFDYSPACPRRAGLIQRLAELRGRQVDIPLVINGQELRSPETADIRLPHERAHCLGVFHQAQPTHVEQAIEAAVAAGADWGRWPLAKRAEVFLKAADLLSGPWRDTLNAATMLAQSKNVFQAEIDAACELIDFLRFNVHFAEQIEAGQPISTSDVTNRLDYRPLEGFVFAVPPFNFTSISANLAIAPAIMGNTVVWKPADPAVYASYFFMRLLQQAGLPDGVINFVPGDGPTVGRIALGSPLLAGLHFTGSVATFQHLWGWIGEKIGTYRSYPRVVGETGGKDFIVAHPSADPAALATAIVRGAFEYQGQKCSAASRVYIPQSLWPGLRDRIVADTAAITMGPVEDFGNFMNAVIDRKAFTKIISYMDWAHERPDVEVLAGGGYSDEIGYFIQPTVVVTGDPMCRTMCEEIFGPVVTIFVYDDSRFDQTLQLVDETSPYALTGAIFAQDRAAVEQALTVLRNAAGNFYVNDKPTGAVVGQQPFGGARASGTNDKAGSYLNLTRWSSPRSIKETLSPATDFRYPFMEKG
ncbi:MAG: L-glutamate gamma-semialdehyde dehydrogenase [Planctomycetota bacterium]|jgi:1-pyrroline-5-carboxylate dehydrogenase